LLWICCVALNKHEVIVVPSNKAMDAFFRRVAADVASAARQEDVHLIEAVIKMSIKTELQSPLKPNTGQCIHGNFMTA
jgi:hypothetical protein